MTKEELREKIRWIVSSLLSHQEMVDEILALPEIKHGLELIKIAEAIATRKKEEK